MADADYTFNPYNATAAAQSRVIGSTDGAEPVAGGRGRAAGCAGEASLSMGGLLVATDLDACLLDEQTYSWEPARPALAALRSRGAVLVLASSKTRAEMEPLARALELDAPLIVENGGALVVPARLSAREAGGVAREAAGAPESQAPDGEALVVRLGVPRPALAAALAELARDSGAQVRGFASLSTAEVAVLTDLPPAQAALALEREWDEPFVLTAGSGEAIASAARRRGLRVTRGGRFFHLTGDHDKGTALSRLLELLRAGGRELTTIALGDSPNDLELLRAAEQAIVIPRAGGPDPALVAALPHAAIAPEPGPSGWNRAVLRALASPRASRPPAPSSPPAAGA